MDQYALCTPDDIKGITSVTASEYKYDDPMIKSCILIATSQIEKYCGRPFAEQQVTDSFTMPATFRGGFKVFPSMRPVKDGTLAATLDGIDAMNELSAVGGGYSLASTPDIYPRTIRITYTGGLAARGSQDWDGVIILDAPGDLVQACAMQASYLANRFLKDNVGEKAQGAKAGNYHVIPEVAVLIRDWMRPKYMGAA